MVYVRVDENIHLELVSPFNAEIILQIINKNRMYLGRYLSWIEQTNTVDPIIDNTKKALLSYAEKKSIEYVIKHCDGIIGRIGIWEEDEGTKIYEIGYWIDEEYSNQGIMTKCVKKVIEIGFDLLKANKIEICCAVENSASNRIPIKLGFKLEGVRRKCLKVGETIFDLNIYGLIIEDNK